MLQFLGFIRIFSDLILLILVVVIIRKPLKAFNRQGSPSWLMLTTKILGPAAFYRCLGSTHLLPAWICL